MPSQEDYLDKLLDEMEESGELPKASEPSSESGDTVDVDEVSELSEDEIQELLQAGVQRAGLDVSEESPAKARGTDRNMADGTGLSGREASKEASGDKADRIRQTLDKKKRRKEEAARKKAAKREAKEAKAARKEADRLAKAAGKSAGKDVSKQAGNNASAEKRQAAPRRQPRDGSDDNLFDKELLDFIVSEAETLEKEAQLPEGEMPEAAEGETVTARSVPKEAGFDLDSVLDDTNVDVDLLAENAADAGKPEMGELPEQDESSEASDKQDEPSETSDKQDEPLEASDKMDEFIADASADMEEEPEKKQGLFSKMADLLTEEDEESEEDVEKAAKAAEKKKAKKAKPKKEKPAKPKKAPKPAKPKKVKPPKEESDASAGKHISFKNAIPVILVGISVGVLLFVFINASVEYVDKQTARAAFQAGDYQTCYENLFGKELNESDEALFGKAKSILYIRLWVQEYEMYLNEGDQVRALDSLIRTVDQYPELYRYAAAWNALPEVEAEYGRVLSALSEGYGLTEENAREIAALPRDVEYTRTVTAIAQGQAYGANTENNEPDEDQTQEPDQMEDPLPEEEELGGDTFIDNQ
ncbi:MAG: hypothetical protein K2O06_05760 [Acetatifactor sp.]|nr:hypothetical protein [Acetatifactor sp.]